MQGYATVPATSDAKEYLRLLLRHKLGLFLTLALGVGLATLYLISKAPTYEASTLLEVSESGSLTGADNTPSWVPPKDLKQEANILRSRKVLTPVVDNFQLRNVIEPKKIPVLGDVTLRVPVLAEWISSLGFAKQYAWGETNVEVTDFSVPKNWEDEPLTLVSLGNDSYSLQHNDRAIIESAKVGESIVVQMPPSDEQLKLQIGAIDAPEGVQFNLMRLSVQTTISDLSQNLITETTDAKSSMITIKLRGEDPAQTADLVNAIAEEYSSVKLASERKDADAQLAFYRGSLPGVEADYLAAQQALAAYRMEIGSYSQNSQVQNALQQMNRLDAQLSDLNIELAQKQARYTTDHPDIRRLEKDIAEIRTERRVYSGRVARSPIVERELSLKENDVATTLELFNDKSPWSGHQGFRYSSIFLKARRSAKLAANW